MNRSHDAWVEVGEQLKAVGSRLRDSYQTHETTERVEPPSQDDLKGAFEALGESATAAFGTVSEAFKDPEIAAGAKKSVALFFDALGATFSELGAELSRHEIDDDTTESEDSSQTEGNPVPDQEPRDNDN